ncbi:interleukin-24 isoform X4 [Macaca mulatta]|uniref:Interleukin 24 n=4 Tax=Cercopithecinae TaxID=9528 RepID=A0A2K5P2R8_CERAT|nr:interleukin-24 isoform X3 [Theropithecus gelada]
MNFQQRLQSLWSLASRPFCPPLLATVSQMQMAVLPCLGLILLLWSQVPGVQGQEFQFGPCQVKGVVPQKLWEAFWAVKDTVQSQDNIRSVRLLQQEVLQNVSQENEMFSIRDSAHRRFLLFRRAFKQLDIEAALTKALGEVDILLTWMQQFYKL